MLDGYRIRGADHILTPALVVYPEQVHANIQAALSIMGGDANRWRPHLKTAKMAWVVRQLLAHGVQQFKCATTAELRMACAAGAPDVLVAFPLVAAHVQRVREIAGEFPGCRISVLVENAEQTALWHGSPIDFFIDVNPGMDRTGIQQDHLASIVELSRGAGAKFRGIHYYDGHVTAADPREREREAHAGYGQLLEIVRALETAGIPPGEVITSGTPALPCSLSFEGLRTARFTHRASPGTIVFNDSSSLAQLPGYGFRPAALVLSSVVSHPAEGRVTCDAGHKAVSADAGVPTCSVLDHEDWTPLKPSEEHLPISVPSSAVPAIGEQLYLLPRHICPTVNLFDEALLVQNGEIAGAQPITARGHERSPVPGGHTSSVPR